MDRAMRFAFAGLALLAMYTFLTAGIVFFMGYAFEPFLAAKMWASVVRSGTAAPRELQLVSLVAAAAGFAIVLINPHKTKQKHRYGNAHWARKGEVKKMGLFARQGVILGSAFGNYVRSNECLSSICLAPPKSGKSATWIIPNLLSLGGSIVCYDVKGALYQYTSLFRSQFSKIIVFNPTTDGCPSFNMLASNVLPAAWFDQVREVGVIARSLFPDPASGKESHWIVNARRIFRLFSLMHINEAGGTSIPEVRHSAIQAIGFRTTAVIDGKEKQLAGLKAFLGEYLDDAGDSLPTIIVEEASSIMGIPDNELGSITSTFTTGVEAFADDRCAAAFSGQSEIIPRQLKTEKISMYIVVSDKDSKVFQAPLRMLFEATASQLMEEEIKPGEEITTLVVDEFTRLGKMDVIMEAPALQRSYGMRTMFAAQSITQIVRIYGREFAEEIMQTTAYKVIYMQNNDAECEAISKACGKRTTTKRNRSRNKDGWSPSESSEGLPLILPQEVGSLPLGHAIVLVQGHKETPIKVIMPYYDGIRAFKARVGCFESADTSGSAGVFDSCSEEDLEEMGIAQF